MRTPLTVTRAGAVKELTAALCREKRSVKQIRIRAVLAVAKGDHVPTVAQSMSVAERGSHPRRWRQTEYKWVDLFGAACPSRGEAVGYLMPTADTFCMNLHLAEINRSVASEVQVALVLDGSGWHSSKELRVPDNITLIPLPPYSPELNPMELVWL